MVLAKSPAWRAGGGEGRNEGGSDAPRPVAAGGLAVVIALGNGMSLLNHAAVAVRWNIPGYEEVSSLRQVAAPAAEAGDVLAVDEGVVFAQEALHRRAVIQLDGADHQWRGHGAHQGTESA